MILMFWSSRWLKHLLTRWSSRLAKFFVGPCVICLVFQTILAKSAWAIGESTTLSAKLYPDGPERSAQKPPFTAEAAIENIQYLTPSKESSDLDQSQFISVRARYLGKTAWFDNAVDAGAATFLSPAESHLLVQELYTTARTQQVFPNFRVSLGRKKIPWSAVDAEWSLGLWQPYYEIDALRPIEQGLTGAFFDYDAGDLQILAFATPFFIPSMGPATTQKDGTLVTHSRWTQTPPKEAGIGDKVDPLSYSLNTPDANKTFNHAGYAIHVRAGRPELGPWFATSAASKPVNQLLVGRVARNTIATEQVGVTVMPEVDSHRIYAADFGYGLGSGGVTASYLQDQPAELRPQADWVLQKIEPLTVIALGAYWKVPQLKTRAVVVRADWLKTHGGEIQDIGAGGQPDALSNEQYRVKFSNAFRLRGEGELVRWFQRPLFLQMSWLYDRDQRGSMVNTEFRFSPNVQWTLLAGADFLGVQDESQVSAHFLSQYRANDRVYGGMTYVF
jgi:hypothetical protein